MKNKFLQLERNLYSMRLVKTIVKTVIYVICDKYEFLAFLFSNCYQIPQLNYNFKRLAVSLHHIILMVNIMLTFVEKICFTLINVSACPQMLQQSPLFVKKTSIFLCAQFQTPTCFETAQLACVPKHLSPQKYFSSISIRLKLR